MPQTGAVDTVVKTGLPTTSQIALALLAFLAIGPFVTGLDLWLRFLPDYPAIAHFRAAGALGHGLWIGSGVLALATIALIVRRQFAAAAIVGAAFTAANVWGGNLVWAQTTVGNWLALGAFALCAASAIGNRAAARQ